MMLNGRKYREQATVYKCNIHIGRERAFSSLLLIFESKQFTKEDEAT